MIIILQTYVQVLVTMYRIRTLRKVMHNMENFIITELQTPISDEVIKSLKCGQMVHITGDIYTGRDAAHKRMVEMLEKGLEMPFEFKGNIIFYAGPSPTKPGDIIGSIGPTTAGRMDIYAPILIEKGLKSMIGKGFRQQNVIDSIVKHAGIYFAGIGGIAALMSESVKSVEIIAFEDLGTEAIRKLKVEKFPCIVAVDYKGNDVYKR